VFVPHTPGATLLSPWRVVADGQPSFSSFVVPPHCVHPGFPAKTTSSANFIIIVLLNIFLDTDKGKDITDYQTCRSRRNSHYM
jgi:hypothetical protein